MNNMHVWLIDYREMKYEEQPWGGTDTVATLIRNCLCPGTPTCSNGV